MNRSTIIIEKVIVMTLTTTGIILWSLAIGLLIFGLLGKIGNHKTDEKQGDDRKQHKGGCCG
jgi:hypothetical protein